MNLTPEKKKLFDLTIKLKNSLNLDEEVAETVIVLINTPRKLEKLIQWVDSITVDGVIQTNEYKLLNMVSEIDRTEESNYRVKYSL